MYAHISGKNMTAIHSNTGSLCLILICMQLILLQLRQIKVCFQVYKHTFRVAAPPLCCCAITKGTNYSEFPNTDLHKQLTILKARLTGCLVKNILKSYFQKFMSTCPLGRAAISARKRCPKSLFPVPFLLSDSNFDVNERLLWLWTWRCRWSWNWIWTCTWMYRRGNSSMGNRRCTAWRQGQYIPCFENQK